MSTTAFDAALPRIERISHMYFAIGALALIATFALIAGWLPITFSIVTVFLFAGPHNWVEARYFLSRLPARWGRLRGFFLFGFVGVVGLTLGFAALSYFAEMLGDHWLSGLAGWNTLLALWIATLVHLRSRQNPRRDWLWVWPIAFFLIALAWQMPMLWSLGLVYLHPLIALWILDREIRRTQPEFRRLYHVCLLAIPICLGLLWWKLAGAVDLEGDDLLRRITHHAGADLLEGVSSHLLVATHTFLEAVHYGVWLLAIPWLGARTNLWNVSHMPIGRRSPTWTRVLQVLLTLSACVVVALWLCFYANYPITRDIYFLLAMVHVLAEAPFLLRAL